MHNRRCALPAVKCLEEYIALYASVDNYFRVTGCHWTVNHQRLKCLGPFSQVPPGILSGTKITHGSSPS